MTNPYAPPPSHVPVLQRYPNPHAQADRSKVTAAGVTMIVLASLQLLASLYLLSKGGHRQLLMIVGLIGLAEGGITLLCGVMTLRNSYGAAVFGLVLCCIGLLLSLVSFNIIGIVIRLVAVILIGRAVNAIKEINLRVNYVDTYRPPPKTAPAATPAATTGAAPPTRAATAAQANPLVAYYHHVIRLLVGVMSADGHIDRRESRKIAETCDAMNISSYERDRVLLKAAQESIDVSAEAQQCVALAEQLGLANPKWQLIIAALSVAGADGVITEAEEKVIGEIGKALDLATQELWTLLAQQQIDAESLSDKQAAELLGVEHGAAREAIEAAYETLSGELGEGDFSHLGGRLDAFVAERQKVLDRARQKLTLG